MKEPQKKVKRKKSPQTEQLNCSYIFTLIVTIIIIISLIFFAYIEHNIPRYNTCYIKYDDSIVLVDSVYNDLKVLVKERNLHETDLKYFSIRTDEFLEDYSKLDDCSLYGVYGRINILNRIQQ